MRHTADLGTLVIANGGSSSTAYTDQVPGAIALFGSAVDFQIEAPATLDGTATVQVAATSNPASSDFRNAIVGGATITLVAGQSALVPVVSARGIRVTSSVLEGAERTFKLLAQVDMA